MEVYKRRPEDCPTCNGWLWIEKLWKWIKYRSTKGLICQTCGHDYGED